MEYFSLVLFVFCTVKYLLCEKRHFLKWQTKEESKVKKIFSQIYVREMKEQSVRVKQFILAHKNVAQKECAPRY